MLQNFLQRPIDHILPGFIEQFKRIVVDMAHIVLNVGDDNAHIDGIKHNKDLIFLKPENPESGGQVSVLGFDFFLPVLKYLNRRFKHFYHGFNSNAF